MIVAIAGATGTLGQYVAAGCLNSPFRGSFREVRILTRNPSSPIAQELQQAGAIVKQIDFKNASSLEEALKEATIVIDVLGSNGDGHQNKDSLLEAISRLESVKYYIPSEFGLDTRSLGFDHPEWTRKAQRANKAREFGRFRVISVFPGAFMEIAFGPWLGFDIQNQIFTSIGNPDTPFSVTSKSDIGLSVASICSQIAKGTSTEIPDYVKISGSTLTYNQAAELFNKFGTLPTSSQEDQHPGIVKKILEGLTHHHHHHQDIKVEVLPLEAFKNEALAKPSDQNLLDCLRFSIAEGYLDNTKDNSNKLVNPTPIWNFTTVEDYIKIYNGRPFCKDSPQVDLGTPLEQVKQKVGLPELVQSHFTADVGQKDDVDQVVGVGSTSLP